MNLGVGIYTWKEEKWGEANRQYLASLQFGIAVNLERTERFKIPA